MNTPISNASARTLNRLRILTDAADAGVWERTDRTHLACVMFDKGAGIRVPGESQEVAIFFLGDTLCNLGVITAPELAWARDARPNPGPRPVRPEVKATTAG